MVRHRSEGRSNSRPLLRQKEHGSADFESYRFSPEAHLFGLGREGCRVEMTFRNAFSKSAGFSDASTSWAISTKRLCRSASVSLGKRFVEGFLAMRYNVASSKGSSSWSGSGLCRFPRQKRGRLGRLFCPSLRVV